MNKTIPRPEFPRPDFERNEWLNLNGEWDFSFDDEEKGEKENWFMGKGFSEKILVPFCYQSEQSGVADKGMHEVMWYKRNFTLHEALNGKRVLLKFGAVDFYTKVWVNGIYAGDHKGGYTPFNFEISNYINPGENLIVVKVEDRYDTVQPRGKQFWKDKPDRCWYTATSGIWQTVWLEAIGEIAIDRIKLTPDIDNRMVLAELFFDKNPKDLILTAEMRYNGNLIKKVTTDVEGRIIKLPISVKEADDIDEYHHWTPESPNLYDIYFTLEKEGDIYDFVKSYFGMRKISVKGDMILLNNRPYYQKLILDQGYWTESLLTPPSDEAIQFDIEMTKKMGFNGARKHHKIEDPRYYYWADKIGLLVWGEMPSAYLFNVEEIENITSEWMAFIKRDYNHPCIVIWVPLNESWGVRNIYTDKEQQEFAEGLYHLTKGLDKTRLISTNDGWEQVDSDICAVHDYAAYGNEFIEKYKVFDTIVDGTASWRMLYAEGTSYNGQPIIMTEYGGVAFESEESKNWGYGGKVKDEESFFARFESLTQAIKDNKHFCGYCYTQLTDVMQEINGLLTPDRKLKVSLERIQEVNK